MEDQFDNTPDQNDTMDTESAKKTVDAAETAETAQEPEVKTEPAAEEKQPEQEKQAGEKVIYTDPNAGIVQTKALEHEGHYQYGQNNQSQQQGAQYQQYDNNFEYNTSAKATGYKADYYEGKEDNSPMSLGDWLLTILALIIPCAGIVLYFVWAFGKDVNVNRRNYCRAALIVEGIKLVLGLIIGVIFVFAIAASGNYYYY